MKDLKIRFKMILAFCCILALIVLLNGISLINMRQVSNQAPNLYNGPHITEVSAVGLYGEIYRMDGVVEKAISSGEAKEQQTAFEECKSNAEKEYKALSNSNILSGDSSISEIGNALNTVYSSGEKIFKLVAEGKTGEAAKEMDEVFDPAAEAGTKALYAISTRVDKMAEAAVEDAVSQTNRAVIIQDILFVLIVILTLATAFKMSADITRPVEKLAQKMQEISKGNFSVEMENQTGDEIGQLSRQLGGMLQNIQGYISDITYILSQIADGNVALEVTREYIGDYSAIKSSLCHILESMNDLMVHLRTCADEVNASADGMAERARSLSGRAEQQSAEIENFRQYLGRVSELTKGDAENAVTIKKISLKATDAVMESDSMMKEMTTAMQHIEDSSREIAKVIKLIEDIAFQTNILALNAAVEAARAGEAGKGFAVVADEVRNLAAKSGEAANNTTAMIKKAIEAVSEGIRITDVTASCLGDVKESVTSMSGILANIDASTEEQVKAFDVMSDSVEHMYGIVQENASVAEENASAAEELTKQSRILESAVRNFKTR